MNLHLKTYRRWLMFFIIALFLIGITALPVESELRFIISDFPSNGSIKGWLQDLLIAVRSAGDNYPFLFYGYDWLAFVHIVLAILFIGPYMEPVKNKWVVQFGIVACMLIIPFALIAGHFRGIPLWWRLIDCSFGIIGSIPLLICLKKIRQLEEEEKLEAERQQSFNFFNV